MRPFEVADWSARQLLVEEATPGGDACRGVTVLNSNDGVPK